MELENNSNHRYSTDTLMDQTYSSQELLDICFTNPTYTREAAIEIGSAQSFIEPFTEPNPCCCEQYQSYLYTKSLEEKLARERVTIESFQDERLQIQCEFREFRLQTQQKTDRIERRVDGYEEYLKRTVAATERLEQALKQITTAQEHGKEDDALRALMAMRSCSMAEVIEPSWKIEQVDPEMLFLEAFDSKLDHQGREELLALELESLVDPENFGDDWKSAD